MRSKHQLKAFLICFVWSTSELISERRCCVAFPQSRPWYYPVSHSEPRNSHSHPTPPRKRVLSPSGPSGRRVKAAVPVITDSTFQWKISQVNGFSECTQGGHQSLQQCLRGPAKVSLPGNCKGAHAHWARKVSLAKRIDTHTPAWWMQALNWKMAFYLKFQIKAALYLCKQVCWLKFLCHEQVYETERC